jgi:hypothetical protein
MYKAIVWISYFGVNFYPDYEEFYLLGCGAV